MGFWVYILKSDKDGKLYIGQTSNLEKRLLAHETGRVKSTKYRRPLRLVHVEEFESRCMAMRRERELKGIESVDLKRDLRQEDFIM